MGTDKLAVSGGFELGSLENMRGTRRLRLPAALFCELRLNGSAVGCGESAERRLGLSGGGDFAGEP
jgi:hypothetical protein